MALPEELTKRTGHPFWVDPLILQVGPIGFQVRHFPLTPRLCEEGPRWLSGERCKPAADRGLPHARRFVGGRVRPVGRKEDRATRLIVFLLTRTRRMRTIEGADLRGSDRR